MAKRHTNKVGDLESMFLRLEELVLANSGEDEFEEVYKLVIAKLWDEHCGKKPRFEPCETHEGTYRSVVSLLTEASRAWPGVLEGAERPALRPEHLHVCVSALAVHNISESSLQVLDSFFEFMVARSAKGSKGQYFTPRHVVELCVRMLQPGTEETVVDPACGSGGFLIHTLNYIQRVHEFSPQSLTHYAQKRLWGFDIDARAIRVARALMVLAGDGASNIVRLNSLLKPEVGGLFPITSQQKPEEQTSSTLTIEDVTRSRIRHHKGFDIVLTNPPFAGEVRENRLLTEYELGRGKPRIERDILFVERCLDILRPGGRMAIVLPHNKFAVDSFSYVRKWIIRKAKVLAVIGLGRHTFLPHTHQKASVLFLQKRLVGELVDEHENVFFGISEREGKNSKGQLIRRHSVSSDAPIWDAIDHDFEDLLSSYSKFSETQRHRETEAQ